MTLAFAVVRLWWRDAIAERFKWFIRDLRGDDSTGWDKVPTGEWLAPARKKIGSSK